MLTIPTWLILTKGRCAAGNPAKRDQKLQSQSILWWSMFLARSARVATNVAASPKAVRKMGLRDDTQVTECVAG